MKPLTDPHYEHRKCNLSRWGNLNYPPTPYILYSVELPCSLSLPKSLKTSAKRCFCGLKLDDKNQALKSMTQRFPAALINLDPPKSRHKSGLVLSAIILGPHKLSSLDYPLNLSHRQCHFFNGIPAVQMQNAKAEPCGADRGCEPRRRVLGLSCVIITMNLQAASKSLNGAAMWHALGFNYLSNLLW